MPWLALAYAAPVLPYSMLATPALSIVPPIYAKHGALSLAAVSVALLAARTFDALIDPVIGVLADRGDRVFGRRAWIQAATLLAMVAAYFWLQVGPHAGFGYFLGWSACLCLAWSMFEIPHRALLAELVEDARAQARLAAWRTGMSRLGVLACLLVLQHAGETSLVTPQTLGALASIVVPLLLVTGVVFQLGTARAARGLARRRDGDTPEAQAGDGDGDRNDQRGSDGPGLDLGPHRFRFPFQATLLRMDAVRRLLGVSALQGVATGMTSALYFLYMDRLLGIADRIPMIALVAGGVGLAGAWLCLPAIDRIGHVRTLVFANAGMAALLAAFCLVRPDAHAGAMVTAIFVVAALAATGLEISMVSLAARIVAAHRARTGHNLAASFFSFERFVSQIGVALGAGLALLWAGAGGFSATDANGAAATAMFMGAFAVVPALLHAAAGLHARGLANEVAR